MRNLLFMLAFSCCYSCESPEKSEAIIPITLDRQLALVNGDERRVDNLHILSGNGEYYIVYPKHIYVDGDVVAYSSSIVSIYVENDQTIVVKDELSDNSMIVGYFILTDKKGAKRLFTVDFAYTYGHLYDFEELEAKYLNESNYWQQ